MWYDPVGVAYMFVYFAINIQPLRGRIMVFIFLTNYLIPKGLNIYRIFYLNALRPRQGRIMEYIIQSMVSLFLPNDSFRNFLSFYFHIYHLAGVYPQYIHHLHHHFVFTCLLVFVGYAGIFQ